MRRVLRTTLFLFAALPVVGVRAETVIVDSKEALLQAGKVAKPGTVIQIQPGNYPGGIFLNGLAGSAAKPIVIESANAEAGSVIFSAEKGGNSAIHLSGCAHLILRSFSVSGFPVNGINADDARLPQLASGLRFENLVIENTGPKGNHDALKLSGLKDFVVTGCTFRGWGGSGIDMVGCHEGVIEKCVFEGRSGFSQANGVQMKGGSSRILVAENVFKNAGQRAVNLGGSTGLPYFRPADATWEAREIEVAGNRFIGSLAPIAWVGIDGGNVHHNTIYKPDKWVARILQENTDGRFGKCRNGRFENNLVVFDRRVRVFVNVGGNTEPDSFTFRDNAWFDVDDPKRGPQLPVEQRGAVVGVDPEFSNPDAGELKVGSRSSRLKEVGAGAFRSAR